MIAFNHRYLQLLRGEDEEAAFLARDKLIMHNLRLVAHIARKYQGSGHEAEDYISIGILGLLKAIGPLMPEGGSSQRMRAGVLKMFHVDVSSLRTWESDRKRMTKHTWERCFKDRV